MVFNILKEKLVKKVTLNSWAAEHERASCSKQEKGQTDEFTSNIAMLV